ncbi:MAG: Peptidoglycan-associated outer membrane protein [Candidatus Magasanikbacteria bacterium GW2011_GWA2_45_39]|uniref:Peptidoglycan-associated outer membrane protein n=2 Tax=Candidatus Magasanikiibacteriota TaxID=1752731 RepID=A0A0G1N1P1_9BACT|nr:MAG: Peptidoglycan-associated outer membrane protein [Candidatus Magasanikbacteria bacterium GW2011_GWA2_45_39]KKU14267.1 MAG: Peptidoglycan-associated outer membrane protein [Candidatus Magasanikbacteria bacterium GW2011_GWC2_45_8]HBW74006.1 hypothetical protein [Candidatus Magasanikbacteria bacterium]
MANLKKSAYVVAVAALFVAIFPFAYHQNKTNSTAQAAAEIRLTKGTDISGYDISDQYAAYRAYQDGAYNVYVYSFADKSTTKVNAAAIAVDALGPYILQRYVYWVDHVADGWIINQHDILTGANRVIKKTDMRIQSISLYDEYVTYIVKVDDTHNNVVLVKLSDLSEHVLTDGKSWSADVAVFKNFVVWSQYPHALGVDDTHLKGDIMSYQIDSQYAHVLLPSMEGIGYVGLVDTTLAFMQRVNNASVISIYYMNTGTSYQLTSSDKNAAYPSLSMETIAYMTLGDGQKQISYLKFGSNQWGILSTAGATKMPPQVSHDGKKIAWLDNRAGTMDLYYYDFVALSEELDQDKDGLSDAEETKLGTNVYSTDTDNDGLTDREEVERYHTNPTKWDTDGDGLSDGEEVLRWTTNPLKADSNSNGLTDVQDLKTGFSPITLTQQFTSYAGVMRWPGLGDEYRKSEELRDALNVLLGAGHWRAHGNADWFKMVNAYIYGGYSAEEVASYARGNGYALSANTPAEYWRTYQAGIGHSTTAYIFSGKNVPVQKTVSPKQYQAKKFAPKNLPKVYSSAEVTPSSVKNVYKATYYLLP